MSIESTTKNQILRSNKLSKNHEYIYKKLEYAYVNLSSDSVKYLGLIST